MTVAESLGIRGGKSIEEYVNEKLNPAASDLTGAFGRYLSGRAMPSRTIGPQVSGPWLDRVEKIKPGASDIFRTPFWYLLEKDQHFTFSELLECVQQLPIDLQVAHLLPGKTYLPPPHCFRLPMEEEVLWIIPAEAAWHYGSLACVFRIAELKGNLRVARRALLCLIKALDLRIDLCSLNSWPKPILQEVRRHLAEFVSIWLSGLSESSEIIDLDAHMAEHGVFEAEYFLCRATTRLAIFKFLDEPDNDAITLSGG